MVTELPSGTVTLMFTDIEGSTRLLEELGAPRFADALEEHGRIVRTALAEHGGIEVDTQGDSFFCSFSSAPAAVACAAAVQDALASTAVRIRIGLHTGEAFVAGDRYVGMDVHRAARIGACGHGGQIVLSATTVALLEPGSAPLRDLGEHRLKDLSAPVRLHQIGDDEFPPLKTLYRTTLPIPATPFLGREREVAELVARVDARRARLLTLTGPGGTGKTRLALQAAAELSDRFPDGVFWVPLAALRDPALVPSAVAQSVRIEEEPGASLHEAVAHALESKTLLLLLDNCEHLLEGVVSLVAPVLARCPNVVVLATSREPLSVGGEEVVALDPLERADAVALFTARAAAAGAVPVTEETRVTVDAICARLDDLPLAVELAAARTAALPVHVLLERLSARLDLLRGPRDADERQRTLRATIDWSYDLLTEDERLVFQRMAVFTGGATLDAAESVCETDLDNVLSLVAKSLVRQQADADAAPRYWMLETVRELALEHLEESDEAETVRQRHFVWFEELSEQAWPHIQAGGGRVWLERLERDRENLRIAFAHAQTQAEEPGGAAALTVLASALSALHDLHGRYAEAQETLLSALEYESDRERLASLTSRLARVAESRDRADESDRLHREAERLLGTHPEQGSPDRRRTWLDVKLAQAHHHYWQADHDSLRRVIEELRPYVDAYGEPGQRADFLHVQMQEALRRERYVLSEETEEIARTMYQAAVTTGEVDAEFQIGFALLWRGKLTEAGEHFARGLDEARRLGDVVQEVRCLGYGSVVCRKVQDVEGARARLAELDALDDVYGYTGLHAATHAWVALRDGRLDRAAEHAARALADWEMEGRAGPTVFQWSARFPLLAVEVTRGDIEAARTHARVMLDPSQQPLPEDVAEALRAAIDTGAAARFVTAVELGHAGGYT